MRRAATIAQLGVGKHDGEEVLLTFGESQPRLYWHAGDAKWRSRPRPTITLKGDYKMGQLQALAVNTWRYLSGAYDDLGGQRGKIGQNAYGWAPHWIFDAAAAYAAGLHLEENLSAVWWNFTAGRSTDLAVVRYAAGAGDAISTLADPVPNVAVVLPSGNGVRKWQTTGWVDSTIPAPAKAILAPHLYTRWTGAAADTGGPHLEYLLARWRWAGAVT